MWGIYADDEEKREKLLLNGYALLTKYCLVIGNLSFTVHLLCGDAARGASGLLSLKARTELNYQRKFEGSDKVRKADVNMRYKLADCLVNGYLIMAAHLTRVPKVNKAKWR